jgi:hypothetical protein
MKIAQRPSLAGVRIGQVTIQPDLGNLLHDIQQHEYFANSRTLLNEYARLNVWHSFRVAVPGTHFYPTVDVCRIYAKPATNNMPAQFDAVLYTPSAGATGQAGRTLHGMFEHANAVDRRTIDRCYSLLGWARISALFNYASGGITLVTVDGVCTAIYEYTSSAQRRLGFLRGSKA